jgi:hypothetical protein
LLSWRPLFSVVSSSLLVLLNSKSSHQSSENLLKLLIILNSEGVAVYACLVRLEVLLVL